MMEHLPTKEPILVMIVTLNVQHVMDQKLTTVFLVKILILNSVNVNPNVLKLDIMKTLMNGNVKLVIPIVLLASVEQVAVVLSVMIMYTYMTIPV